MANFKGYKTNRLLDLRRRLNTIFVLKRDKGENIEYIYTNLRRAEDELQMRRVLW